MVGFSAEDSALVFWFIYRVENQRVTIRFISVRRECICSVYSAKMPVMLESLHTLPQKLWTGSILMTRSLNESVCGCIKDLSECLISPIFVIALIDLQLFPSWFTTSFCEWANCICVGLLNPYQSNRSMPCRSRATTVVPLISTNTAPIPAQK